jgi:ubiquinone/menaquinone biosynthesis C-methylase UbiE
VSEAGLRGDDGLARLVAWGQARSARSALDVTGEGDSPLAVTIGSAPRVRFVTGAVEALPFDNAVFDLVACRLAAHRFPHAALAVREMQRVLAPGGSLLLAEKLTPDDADASADATGGRSYRRREWHAFLRAAGLTVMQEDTTDAGMVLLRAEKD